MIPLFLAKSVRGLLRLLITANFSWHSINSSSDETIGILNSIKVKSISLIEHFRPDLVICDSPPHSAIAKRSRWRQLPRPGLWTSQVWTRCWSSISLNLLIFIFLASFHYLILAFPPSLRVKLYYDFLSA